MGKAQSKRSVDITTETSPKDGKVIIEEGTGKMGKIEDVDQLKPQINGDTENNEPTDKEKKIESDEAENEKDITTEKEQVNSNIESDDDAANKTNETTNGNDDTLNDNKNNKSTVENGGDNNKKTKKEKVKKKWSFRSISFSKKDKQKPTKKDDSTTNGDCEKVPEEAQPENTTSVPAVDVTLDNNKPVDETSTIVEVTPEIIVDEKQKETVKLIENVTEIIKTEEIKKDEIVTAAVAVVTSPVVAVDVEDNLKMNVVEVVQEKMPELLVEQQQEKIAEKLAEVEVKIEEKLAEQENTAAEIIVEQIKEIEDTPVLINEVKEAILVKETTLNDAEVVAENVLPPPPLPLIPPPSKVTVFAVNAMSLNDNNTEPILSENDLIKIDNSIQIENNIEKLTENLSNIHVNVPEVVSESEIQLPVDEPVLTNKLDSENVILLENFEKIIPINIEAQIPAPALELDFVEELNNDTNNYNENIVIPSKIIEETINLSSQDEIVDSESKPNIVNNDDDDINLEQITATIELIEKVTDNAMSMELDDSCSNENKMEEEEESQKMDLIEDSIISSIPNYDPKELLSNQVEIENLPSPPSIEIISVSKEINEIELNNSVIIHEDLEIIPSPTPENVEMYVPEKSVDKLEQPILDEPQKQEQDKIKNGIDIVNQTTITEKSNGDAEHLDKIEEIISSQQKSCPISSPTTIAPEIKIAE